MTDGPPLIAAETYLSAMADFGVEVIYATSGTDFPSIAEAYGRAPQRGWDLPEALVCPHENLAVAMAHGHALVTGTPQAVMVHVSVGTSNMVAGAMNAARDQVPMLLTAGRTPVSEDPEPPGSRSRFIHWAQEMFDQASQLREAVKWDYELRRGDQAEAALARALEAAQAPPPGPVYLSLPREVLAEEVPSRPRRRPTPVAPPAPDPDAVDRLAGALRRADLPLLVTQNLGRDPAAVAALEDLAARWALPVVPFNARSMCFPSDHPMHLGHEPGELLGAADLILTVACDVPWIPKVAAPAAEVTHWEIGLDPLYLGYPMRSFPAEGAIQAAPAAVLRALMEAAGPVGDAAPRVEARRSRLADLRARRIAALDAAGAGPELTAASASRALAECLPADATVTNEYTFQIPQGRFTRPGSVHGLSPAGGLGWGFGAALGMKKGGLTGPVVAMLGDGAYMFNNPSACHWAAEVHGLPVLAVIFNNRRWGAVRNSTLAMYPQGASAAEDGMFLADLSPSLDHAAIARAHGAEAWDVRSLDEIPAAMDGALSALAGGRQALIALHLPT
ncbi:thiamine pyrophosphate-requiring protein [Rhodosalinus halophilus]|uniref:Thiamine pyrophosphate-requiring protein n=1 Tax=Rhodosalinus halophilus TaxID=2259333 RepID=A0A365UCH6_9RHOB|nr:thiamine pyrophosphate-requiring protein [Rhodosalinus halophilus]RBI86328.1 thiamine pyrophosphate-requiring protein [Rhodosalinus halophilus]